MYNLYGQSIKCLSICRCVCYLIFFFGQSIASLGSILKLHRVFVINQYKASGQLVFSLVTTILKVMIQFQMLYSCWLDQLLNSWISLLLLPQSLVWLLGFGANHSLLFFVQHFAKKNCDLISSYKLRAFKLKLTPFFPGNNCC